MALLIIDKPDSVICRLAATALSDFGAVSIAKNEASLDSGLRELNGPGTPILIDISTRLGLPKYLSSDFHGLEVAASLRRFHLIQNPIIFLSLFPDDFFNEKPDIRDVAILGSRGSYFLSPPFTTERISELIGEVSQLSAEELDSVVWSRLDLHGAWGRIVHRLETFIRNPKQYRREAVNAVDLMSASVERYAPVATVNLLGLRRRLYKRSKLADLDELRVALDELSAALKGILLGEESVPELPQLPPRGFETIVVADDMPQDYLMHQLVASFGYNVITPQAMKLSDAKHAVDTHLPDIILADMYFKRSTRESESGDKAVGDEFIKYALNHRGYGDERFSRPLVIVTSKAVLDPETEIRKGAIDCSGSRRSSDPAAIHAIIWAEARKRGITKAALLKTRSQGNPTGLSRLEIQKRLVRLKTALHAFQLECVGTQAKLGSIGTPIAKKESPLTQLSDFLAAESAGPDLTLCQVEGVLEKVERAQEWARSLHNADAASLISDILHGGLGQYFHIPREFLSLFELLNRDDSDPRKRVHEAAEERDTHISAQWTPLLEYVDRAITEFRIRKNSRGLIRSLEIDNLKRKKIKIVVVEDNSHWRTFIEDTINDLQNRLGRRFDLQVVNCGSMGDAVSELNGLQRGLIERQVMNMPRIIFVVDLCIPSGHSGASIKIEDDRDIARFEYGLELLELLSSYKWSIPAIVFSSEDYLEKLVNSGFTGIPPQRRIEKASDASSKLAIEMARIIEKAEKYVIDRRADSPIEQRYSINKIRIPLSQELGQLFGLMFDHFQQYSTRSIEIDHLIRLSGGYYSKTRLLNLVYRLRKLIYQSFKVRDDYLDPNYLIETRRTGDTTLLHINAEIMSIDDEEAVDEQLALDRQGKIRVRIEGDAFAFRPDLAWVLHHCSIEPEFKALATAKDDPGAKYPTDFDWVFNRNESSMFIWKHETKVGSSRTNKLLEEIDLSEMGWLGRAIDAVHFHGTSNQLQGASEYARITRPFIEILDGTDSGGSLRLRVNERDFRMNRSPLSRILEELLLHANDFVAWDILGMVARGSGRVSANDKKNWVKRLRSTIKKSWAYGNKSSFSEDKVSPLDVDSRGIRLNAIVIPYQNSPLDV